MAISGVVSRRRLACIALRVAGEVAHDAVAPATLPVPGRSVVTLFTYLANDSPESVYELRDVRTVTGRMMRDATDGRPIAGLLGCPPCQGWSAAGQRDAADRRNRLLKDFFRLVNSVYPVFFVMENVPSVADKPELAAAISTLRGRYRVWQGLLNAAAYGLPQSRQRALVIGYRHDTGVTPACPPPTHAGARKIWDALAARRRPGPAVPLGRAPAAARNSAQRR